MKEVLDTKKHLRLPIVFCFLVFGQKNVAQNAPPVAIDDNYTVGFNVTRTVSENNGLLSNDTDINGTAGLTINTIPINDVSSGSLVLNSDGSFSYAPTTNFIGSDSFTYQVCDDGLPSELISRFDFDTATLTDATVGPNATSINPNAAPIECGLHIPSGFTGGSAGLDLIIPNTSGIFDFTSFEVAFEYRDQESQANLVEGGNFRIYHISGNNLGVQVTVINGDTGVQQTYTQDLGGFLAGNNPYSVIYDEISGSIIYDANGTVTTYNLAPEFSPLDTGLATNITVGRQLDNAGRNFASFCSLLIQDRSALCDTAVVTLDIKANIITNRRITYRVKPN